MKKKILLTFMAFMLGIIAIGMNLSAEVEAYSFSNTTKTETSVYADKIFVVNPIDIEEGQCVILALYDKGKFVEMQTATYSETELLFATNSAYTDAKVMVWEDLESIVPVCKAEIVDVDCEIEFEESIVDVVSEVANGKIYFENGASTIRYTEDINLAILKNGEIVEPSALETNDVVTISQNGAITIIEVINKTIEGKIDGIKSANGGYLYRINDVYYELADGAYGAGELGNGFESTFYLDKNDKIIYWEAAKAVGDIAYVLEVSDAETDMWGDSTIEIKLLTVDGIMTYEMADRFYIGGEEYTLDEPEVAETVIVDLVCTVIKVSVSDEKISKINPTYDTDVFETVASAELEWLAEYNAFGNYDIDTNAIIFNINTDDIDKSSVATFEDFIDREVYFVDLYATYNTVEDADIVVVCDLFYNGDSGEELPEEIETACVLDVSDVDTDLWGNCTIEVKLLTTEGVKIFEVAENIKFDGLAYVLDEDADSIQMHLCDIEGTIVKFALVDDKISSIITTNNEDVFETVNDGSTFVWNAENNAFDDYILDEDSIIFNINSEDVDKSSIATIEDFVDGEEYWGSLYKTSDTVADVNIVLVYDLLHDESSDEELLPEFEEVIAFPYGCLDDIDEYELTYYEGDSEKRTRVYLSEIVKYYIDGVEVTKDDILAVTDDAIVRLVNNNIYSGYDVVIVYSIASEMEEFATIIDGTIDGMKSGDDGYEYRINGMYYKLADGAYGEGAIKNGYEGTFYLDKNDKIIYWEALRLDYDTAYVLEVSDADTDKWGNYTIEVKLLTVEGIKTYEVAERFYIDGEENTLDKFAEEFLACLQGEIVKISTADDKLSNIYTTYEAFEEVAEDEELEWNAEENAFEYYDIDANAIVFSIDTSNIDNSYATTVAELYDENYYYVNLYATSDTLADADIILIEDLHCYIDAIAELTIVTDVAVAINELGEDIFELTIVYEGEETSFKTTNDVYENWDIVIGDVVKFRTNAEGVITRLVYTDVGSVVRYCDGEFTEVITYSTEGLLAGYAYYIKGDTVDVGCGEADPVKVKFDRARRIYFVETKGRDKDELAVTEGEVGDIVWDKDLLVDGTDDYEGMYVADPSLPIVGGTAAEVYTQIYVTYNADGDVDMIFLVAGLDDYEIAE